MATITVTKASGEQEPFSLAKYHRSLVRTGVAEPTIQKVMKKLIPQLHDNISTRELYHKTFELLKKEEMLYASKYSLKESLRLLGPTGFPFEKLVAYLLHYQGYEVKTDQIVQGTCISHEVDILAQKNSAYTLVECKFHNTIGIKSDVQVSLYIKARCDDITTIDKYPVESCLIITNTKFTSKAIQYAECAGINLIAWGYPYNKGIERLIEDYHLYPITTLIGLKQRDKEELLNAGIVLCNEIPHQISLLHSLAISKQAIQTLLNECSALCATTISINNSTV
jgi:Restriction endonuclease